MSDTPRTDDILETETCNSAHTSASLLDRLKEHARALERELAEETAIVNRVWRALGIETYEQANGKAIDQIVADLKRSISEGANRWVDLYWDLVDFAVEPSIDKISEDSPILTGWHCRMCDATGAWPLVHLEECSLFEEPPK